MRQREDYGLQLTDEDGVTTDEGSPTTTATTATTMSAGTADTPPPPPEVADLLSIYGQPPPHAQPPSQPATRSTKRAPSYNANAGGVHHHQHQQQHQHQHNNNSGNHHHGSHHRPRSEDRWSVAQQRITELEDENGQLRLALQNLTNRYQEHVVKVTASLDQKMCEVDMASGRLEAANGLIHRLQSALEEREAQLHLTQEQLKTGEAQRRSLHNTIQELKGNIRVFCRLRPVLSGEARPETAHFLFPDAAENRRVQVIGPVGAAVGCGDRPCAASFNFDKCFPSSSSQSELYQEVSQLVQSALDGYRVAIFAYGQTGSGKTFTMEGSEATLVSLCDHRHSRNSSGSGAALPPDAGIIPRSVETLFQEGERMVQNGWDLQLFASFLEIYNETLRDLLLDHTATDHLAAADRNGLVQHTPPPPLEIRHDADGTTVTNLTSVPVASAAMVLRLLQVAHSHRAVASHRLNERSSRSHSVFMLRIHGTNHVTGQAITGMLNLIDLCGSERLKDTESSGDRLRETQHINRSLSCLGDVMQALSQKQPHVPYRNSKLTYLLQKCLGGDSKTLMIVTVSPLSHHFAESLNSLRFAAKVNACEIGTAKRKAFSLSAYLAREAAAAGSEASDSPTTASSDQSGSIAQQHPQQQQQKGRNAAGRVARVDSGLRKGAAHRLTASSAASSASSSVVSSISTATAAAAAAVTTLGSTTGNSSSSSSNNAGPRAPSPVADVMNLSSASPGPVKLAKRPTTTAVGPSPSAGLGGWGAAAGAGGGGRRGSQPPQMPAGSGNSHFNHQHQQNQHQNQNYQQHYHRADSPHFEGGEGDSPGGHASSVSSGRVFHTSLALSAHSDDWVPPPLPNLSLHLRNQSQQNTPQRYPAPASQLYGGNGRCSLSPPQRGNPHPHPHPHPDRQQPQRSAGASPGTAGNPQPGESERRYSQGHPEQGNYGYSHQARYDTGAAPQRHQSQYPQQQQQQHQQYLPPPAAHVMMMPIPALTSPERRTSTPQRHSATSATTSSSSSSTPGPVNPGPQEQARPIARHSPPRGEAAVSQQAVAGGPGAQQQQQQQRSGQPDAPQHPGRPVAHSVMVVEEDDGYGSDDGRWV